MAIILLLTVFGIYLPHENWLNTQFEELQLRTQPVHLIFPDTKPHSLSQLRKYIETAVPKDATAYLLSHRIEEYLKEFEGFGCNLEFRSDSTSRAFFSPHFGSQSDALEMFLEITLKAGRSDEYPNRTWEDFVASDYMRAYLKTDVKGVSILLGRESLKWGASPIHPLLLSSSSPPFDMVGASYRAERFQFSSFFTILNPRGDTSRYLTGHRIEFALFSKLFVGLSEIVIHGGYNTLPDPYYLNPLVVFYPREWNEGRSRANILWGIDLNYFGSRWSGYVEFMLDDYPYEVTSMNEHPKLGWILGFKMLDLLRKGEYIVIEYAGVHQWCYGHIVPWQRYTYKGYNIGHPLGNDFDRITVNTTEHLGKSIDLEISANYARKGEGKVSDLYPEERFPDPYFLTGVVEKRVGMSIGVRYLVGPLWIIELRGGWENINNYGHLQGISHDQLSINFKLEKLL